MKFTIERVSEWRRPSPKPCDAAEEVSLNGEQVWCVDIETIEDLMILARECESPILIFGPDGDSSDPSLEVYDDYRE